MLTKHEMDLKKWSKVFLEHGLVDMFAENFFEVYVVVLSPAIHTDRLKMSNK